MSWRRTRTVLRIAAAVVIIVPGVLAGFIVLLHNYSFRQRVLRVALPRAALALGRKVHVRDFSLQMSFATPLVSLDGIVVDGASSAQPPLFQADHVEIGLRIVSILKRKWYFNNITMDRPVLRLDVDQDGNTNLPARAASNNGSSVFDLGIRSVLLRHGELYYNDRKIPLDASLRDVALDSGFDPRSRKYSGHFSYPNGSIRFRDWNPLVHSLVSEFEASPQRFTLTHCTLSTGLSQVQVEGTLDDFARPGAKLTYQVSLDSADIESILHPRSLPSGVLRLAGSARFQSDPNRPVLQTLRVDGHMNSSLLGLHTAAIDTELQDIRADYLLQGGDINIRNLRARFSGGTVAGSYAMHDLASAQQSQLQAVLTNVSLSSIEEITHPTTRKQLRLAGTANLTLEATWQKAFDALVARGAADLKGRFAPAASAGAFHMVPIEGRIQAAYSAPAEEVTLTRSYLRMPRTLVRLSGTAGRHQSLQIQAQSDQLHEAEAVARAFGLIRDPVELYGAASFEGTIRGFTAEPQIAGRLVSPFLKIRGTEWRMLRTTLDATPSHLVLSAAEVSTADNAGHLAFDASVGLDRWSYSAGSPFQIELNATRLKIPPLMSLAGSTMPVTGTLSARVSVHGSKDNIAGEGSVNLNQVTVFDETIPSLALNFRGNGDSIHAHVNTRIATGGVQGDLTYSPRRRAYEGRLQAANIRLDQLQTARKRKISLAGILNLTAKGAGSLDDPNLDLKASVLHPQIDHYKLSDIALAADISNRVAQAVFDSQAPYALHGRGKVELAGNYPAEAAFDTAPIPLAPLLAVYLPAKAGDWSGETEVHAMIRGPLKNPSAMAGQVTLPIFSVAYRGGIQLANSEPIHLQYGKGVFTLTKTGIHGTGTDFQLQGTIPVAGNAPMSLIAAGNINLKLVSIINPDYTSSGEIAFHITGRGRRTDPDFKGQIKIVDASFSAAGVPVALQNGNGVANLVDDRLDIDRFQGRLSNGAFTARGNITYRPEAQLNLVMAADGIRTAYPPGIRENIDTNLTLTGPLRSPLLRGQVHVNELSFAEPFNLEEVLYKLARTGQVLSGASGRLNLDLTVQSTNELTPTTDRLTLNGAANLRVRGTVGQPALWGTVRLNSGELLFRGARYVLKPSAVDFVNPSGIEPRLNIAVETRVKEYNVRMFLLGPLDDLRTTISSEPPLPSADAINLLIFGQTNQPITTESAGNLGAVSLLASGVTNTVTSRLQNVVGISQLSIDPALDNNEQGTTVGVTVQQRVTANLFVTFTSDPSSTKRQLLEVEYHAVPNISLIGVVNQNGGFATDIRIRKTW